MWKDNHVFLKVRVILIFCTSIGIHKKNLHGQSDYRSIPQDTTEYRKNPKILYITYHLNL